MDEEANKDKSLIIFQDKKIFEFCLKFLNAQSVLSRYTLT